jgi:hypothetical protein
LPVAGEMNTPARDAFYRPEIFCCLLAVPGIDHAFEKAPRTAVYQDGRRSEPMIDVGNVFPADALTIFSNALGFDRIRAAAGPSLRPMSIKKTSYHFESLQICMAG